MVISPEQKAKDKLVRQQRTNLNTTINKLKAQFSFHNIKTWTDVFKIVGYSDEYVKTHFSDPDNPVTIDELRSFYGKLTSDLERSINGQEIPTPRREAGDFRPPNQINKESHGSINEYSNGGNGAEVDRQSTISNIEPKALLDEEVSRERIGRNKEHDTSDVVQLPPSPNEPTKTFLYHFQKNAAAKILQGYGVIK